MMQADMISIPVGYWLPNLFAREISIAVRAQPCNAPDMSAYVIMKVADVLAPKRCRASTTTNYADPVVWCHT